MVTSLLHNNTFIKLQQRSLLGNKSRTFVEDYRDHGQLLRDWLPPTPDWHIHKPVGLHVPQLAHHLLVVVPHL